MKPYRATDGRSYRCMHCGGIVKKNRRQTLEDVEKIHLEHCHAKR